MDKHYTKQKKILDAQEVEQDLKKYKDLAGGLGSFLGQFAGAQKIAGRMKQAQALIDTYASANKAFAMGGGFPWGLIPMTTSIAMGLANVMAISKQMGEFTNAQTGMDEIVTRPTTILTGEGGTAERVQVTPLDDDEMAEMGGSGTINISFSGNVLSEDWVTEEAIPLIRESLRRGEDMGIA